jgi:hypothetical protein
VPGLTIERPNPHNTVRVDCDGVSGISIDAIFVSIVVTSGSAYMVHLCGSGLHWSEISLRVAELLVALRARAEVGFEGVANDASRI